MESTSSAGTRRYFLGTQSSVSMLNPTTGLYTDIFTNKGAAGTRWKAAELADTVVFVNGHDNVCAYQYTPETGPPAVTTGAIPSLTNTLNVSSAKIVVQYQGFILVMNVVQDGKRAANRIIWSDLNLPFDWDPKDPSDPASTSLAGFQDLDPGDEILAASPMGGRLYIYTRRAIWWISPSGDATTTFIFNQAYTEPKNQTGCLAYPNTLVSTGAEHWYLGRDGIYKFTPYVPAPERPDWLHRASGVIYKKADTKLDTSYCQSPIAEYVPDARELWISWPSYNNEGNNNWCLVAQLQMETADVIDTGYTSLVNFRQNPASLEECNESQDFLGASGVDWCIKRIGDVFKREYVYSASDDITADIPVVATTVDVGYNSSMRGMIPLGLNDRDKIVREVLVDHDDTAQLNPCVMRARIGNSRSLVDPNDLDDICAPQWRDLGTRLLACPDGAKISVLTAKNLRPDKATVWPAYEQGRFLYFEITIENADGTAAVGGDTCLQRVEFDCTGLQRPAL